MAGTEAEDRTQGPSKQRLQQAREHGQVAHSPELTAAVERQRELERRARSHARGGFMRGCG